MKNYVYSENELKIRYRDLVDNPTARVPICLCVDTSYSMTREGNIDRLNAGIRQFLKELREDEIALEAAEICLISFGGAQAELVSDYQSVDKISLPALKASGDTPMGDAVRMAVEKLRVRKEEYKHTGVDYYQPWLVLMSDGIATDRPEVLRQASDQVQELIRGKKLHSVPVGIGKLTGEMENSLMLFAEKRVYCLDDLKFGEFFAWLSSSVAKVSQSVAGEALFSDFDADFSWEKYFAKGERHELL